MSTVAIIMLAAALHAHSGSRPTADGGVPQPAETAPAQMPSPVRFVDPFIGTAGGGNTFPGAVRPWGMVSVSPHTDLTAPSGYIDGSRWFYGLGHVHLSGTGCPELGSIVVTATRGRVAGNPEVYKCTLRDQAASPGYWAGTLVEPWVRMEATVTVRSGIERITPLGVTGMDDHAPPGPEIRQEHSQPAPQETGKGYPAGAGKGLTLLIDAARNLSMPGTGEVRWVSDHQVQGYNTGGGFCGWSNRHNVYFFASFDRAPASRGVWRDTVVDRLDTASSAQTTSGAWATFDDNRPVEIRVGISYVSESNARLNLEREAAGRTFGEIREAAEGAWEDELSRITVSGGPDSALTEFYTALYHALIHPNVISDVNGEYPLFGRPGVGVNLSRERYTVFSLWDTYRTLHPLLALVYPERQSAIVSTMIDMYRESGWLPKWELAGTETHMMAGDGAVSVIADTYVDGIRDFDTATAYAAMRKPGVVLGPEAEPSRPGYADYLKLGYIPEDQDTRKPWWVWGTVSNTLEYCYADWAFSRVARAMGRREDAREFSRRAEFYRNLYDSASGFFRPKHADGRWLSPFDPLATEGSGSWKGAGGPGYVEGNAWQYAWFVPHDIAGVARLMGGADRCAARLDSCFAEGRFTINNEPDIAYPYLYTYLNGHEDRTRDVVRSIMRDNFSARHDGLPGNDDTGEISAWFIFSALGFYPACPASGEYRIGSPLFARASIRLNRSYYAGSEIRVVRGGTPAKRWRAAWNGVPLGGFSVKQKDLTRGGEMRFPPEAAH